MEKAIEKINQSLQERIKELECLYKISQISFGVVDNSIENILTQIIEIIPGAWQFPEIASVKIRFDGTDFFSPDYRNPKHKQTAKIIINNKYRGYIQVSYTKDTKIFDEGPFLKEERNLINTIATEISIIVDSIEQKNQRRILEKKLNHADRLATIGELTASIAHELNEPLASILGFAQLLKKENTSSDLAGDIDKIIESSLLARDIIRKLMSFAKYDENVEVENVNINKIIEEGLFLLDSRCKKENIKTIKILDKNIPEVPINKTRIHQTIVNLVVNAIQAMPNGGELIIQTRYLHKKIKIIVQDTGIGISENNINKIFDPFFTTKNTLTNTGLGLSVVYGIIKSFNGNIEVESFINAGTVFTITLPTNNQENEKE